MILRYTGRSIRRGYPARTIGAALSVLIGACSSTVSQGVLTKTGSLAKAAINVGLMTTSTRGP